MEYLVFPFFSVLFQLKYPKNAHFFKRLSHYLFWVGMILLAMILLGKISNIVNSNMESLIRSFFNFIIELWLCRQYILWFMDHPDFERLEQNEG